MRNRYAKTILALLLSIAMIVGLVPTTSAAELIEISADGEAAAELQEVIPDTASIDSAETDAVAVQAEEPEEGSKARAAEDPRTVSELTVTIGAMSTSLRFPSNVVAASALDTNRQDVVEIAQQAPSMTVRWPRVPNASTLTPTYGAAYYAEVTVTAPANVSFASSLGTTGLSLRTQSTNGAPTVVAENLQIVSNVNNVLVIGGTFSLGGIINSIAAKIAQPQAGAAAYTQPEDVTVRLDDSMADTYVPMTTRLSWQETYIHTAPMLDADGNPTSNYEVKSDSYYDRNMTGQVFKTESGNTYNGVREHRYFYRPTLTVMARGTYRFSEAVLQAQNYRILINGVRTPFDWTVTLNEYDNRSLIFTPKVGNTAADVTVLPIATDGKNTVEQVYIALPEIDMSQGSVAPTLSVNNNDVMKDVTATFNGRYMPLALYELAGSGAVQWTKGVVNGRFDEKDNNGKAQLTIRTATPGGFLYADNFTSDNIEASWKDGNGLGGTQSQDISKYAKTEVDPATGETYLEFTLDIIIQPVQVTAIEDFEWNPEPAIGLSLKAAQFKEIPFRYGANLQSVFPKLEEDYEGTMTAQQIAGKAVLTWLKNGREVQSSTINDVLDFNDTLTAVITMHATDAFRFPERVRDTSLDQNGVEGWRGPTNWRQPEGWEINWGSYAPDPNNATGYDNSAKKLTMRKTFVFPSRIDTIDAIQMADLIVGEAGPQPASIDATSNRVSSAWFSKDEDKLTSEELDTAATWSAETTMYGTTYDVSLTLTSKDPTKFAFDDTLTASNLAQFAESVLKWNQNESAVKPSVAQITAADVQAVKGSGTMTINLKVTIPLGEVRGYTASPGDLQLVAGKPRTKQIKVKLVGGAVNNPDNVGTAGVFAAEATLDADLVWTLVQTDNINIPDTTNPLAIRGRDYLGKLSFTVSGVGQNYVLSDKMRHDILKIFIGPNTETSFDGSAVTTTDLVTTAKLPIDRVELKITPPLRDQLTTLQQNPDVLKLETQATYYADNEEVTTSDIELSGWWDGGTDRYAVNMMVKLTDEAFSKYCFGYGDEKFSWDQVDANIGELVPSLSVFKILGEDYLSSGYDFETQGMPGSGFTVTNYLIPASRAVDKVEVDIIPPWSASKPEVNVRKTSAASDDYQVTTPQVKFTEGDNGVYTGVLTLEARGAAGMDGGSVFRSQETGLKWGNPADAIVLNGMNDAVVTPDFNPARAEKFDYEDDKLIIPFTIRYASQQIEDTQVYVPRPIVGVQPLDHADLASAKRTSRYKVTDTVWQRDENAEAEDPFLATVTLEANRVDPIREFDDEFYFNENFWNREWTPEELAQVVKPYDTGSNPENPVQPQSAEVVDGKLILTLLVYPREVENEIHRLEMNISVPTLSGAERGGQTITQIAYYSKSATTSDMQYAPGSAEVESVIPAENITHANWVRQANGKYRTQYSIRPDSEYTFLNRGGNIVSLKINEGPMPRNIEVTPAGTLTFELECDLTDDIKLVVRTNPTENASDVAVTPEVRAAWPNSQGKVDLKVQPRSGWSLLGTSRDLQMDDRVRVASGSDIHPTAGRGYVYSLTVGNAVTTDNKEYITVRFTPNDVVLPRADGITVTVNGSPYTMGNPIEEGSEVRLQLQSGYELRPGRVLELYNVLTDDKLEELKSTDGNRTFTFTMPDAPVEVYGRIVRPGEPDPDPTPRPSTRPSQDPLDPNDPNNPSKPDDPDDPTASPSASGAPTPSGSPTTKPSSTPSGTLGQDDYVKYGSLEDLETIEGSQITLSGSGADKIIKGYQVKSGSSALARDLAGQYWLPDGLDIQIVDTKGKVLKSTDKVATGHTLQLVNSRKHVLDSAVISLKGDVTGSGVIGISQLVRLAKAVTYENPLKDPYFSAGDFNNNGRIDLGDMVQLATRIAQK